MNHCYPNGTGPDAELISRIESEVLIEKSGVTLNDIAGLEKAKKLLVEAVELPRRFPEFFTVITLLKKKI